MTFDLETFKDDISKYRNTSKLKAISQMSGVPHQTISQIHLGLVKNPSVETVYALCGVLGVNPSKYYTGAMKAPAMKRAEHDIRVVDVGDITKYLLADRLEIRKQGYCEYGGNTYLITEVHGDDKVTICSISPLCKI